MYRKGLIIQFLAAILGSLNVITSGMHSSWSSPSLPKLESNESTIKLSREESSTVVIIVEAGIVAGCLLVGIIIDRVGRKTAVLVSTIPGFASWMFIAFATTAEALIVGRFIAGITDGIIFCSINMYISEIANPNYRGLLGSFIGFSYSLGHLLICVIGWYFSVRDSAIICSVLPVVLLLTFCWMPESPYYLIMKNKTDEAKRSLRILHGADTSEKNFELIVDGMRIQKCKTGKCWDLVRIQENRKSFFIAMILYAVQQGSGEAPINFYTQTIFTRVKSVISPELCTVVYMSIGLLAVLVSSIIIDKIGRKPLLIFSMGGTGFLLFVSALYSCIENRTNFDVTNFSFIPFVALTGQVFVFSLGLQTIPITMAAELFHTSVKTYGVSACDLSVSLFASAACKYFQITYDSLGLEVPFFSFGMCCILGAIFVRYFVPETKNKTLEEIQLEI